MYKQCLSILGLAVFAILSSQSAWAQSSDEQLVHVTLQLVVATWALAGGTIGVALISIILGYKAHNLQKAISESQRKLVTAQEESVKEQKKLVASQQALTNLTTMLKIFDQLNDEESRRYRRLIFDVEGNQKATPPADYGDKKAHVRGQFDQIGVLIRANLLPIDLFMASYDDTAAKVWLALKKDLRDERTKRSDKLFQESFNWHGGEAEKYWNAKHLNQTLEIY